jgi:glycerate kinase
MGKPVVLCAPASLKGVLDATQAADAIASGVREAGAAPIVAPVADGGEGTAAVLQTVLGGEWRAATVADPLGRPHEARFLLLPDRTVVVEAAAAIGLPLLEADERDPLRATSDGFGDLMLAALATRPQRLLVCVGGTATVDGGRGLRRVVGTALDRYDVQVACDVTNPLLGANGAARVYGPQKGASAQIVDELETLLAEDPVLRPYAGLPGAGSGGGLGAALAALGGRLVAGANLVLDLIGFGNALRNADLCITGEGCVDDTTFSGKAPALVAARAEREGVGCIVFGGLVVTQRADATIVALSGDPTRAAGDLVRLGRSWKDHLGAPG